MATRTHHTFVKPIRRIALLCGGLEPARDGIGDYLRQLAAAFVERDIDCLLLGLNDRLVDRVSESFDESGFRPIKVVRLPKRLSARERFAAATKALADWKPDWVSLHIVVYAFNRKGILTSELWWLPKLVAPYPLHVQMHELWIGETEKFPRRDAVVGAMQRWALLTLLRRLSPEVLRTSVPLYQHLLRHYGIEAGILPLGFGNIPVSDCTGEKWLFPAIQESGGPDLAHDRTSYWLVGLFGAIYADWSASNDERILARIGEIAMRAGRRVVVASIGRAGASATVRFERWRKHFPQMSFAILGMRPVSEVSQFLNMIDFGLSSTPGPLIGKSSSAAAMLDHGIPLIMFSDDRESEPPSVPGRSPDLVWTDDQKLEARMKNPPRQERRYNGPTLVIDQMVADFESFHKLRQV